MGANAVSVRYFRATPSVYQLVCEQLDTAYSYPNADTKTLRTLPPADTLPADSSGRLYLAVSAEYCDFILPSQMLSQLLSSGAVDEIDEREYAAVVPSPGA